MSRLVLVVVGALALGLPHGADAACTPCEDACREEGRKMAEDPQFRESFGDKCMCEYTDDGGGTKFEKPKLFMCSGDCCSRILGEGEVGTTGHVPTTKSAIASPSGSDDDKDGDTAKLHNCNTCWVRKKLKY